MKIQMQRLFGWLLYNIRYLGKPPWDTGVSPPELLAFIQQHPPGKAIDLGCGTGTNLLTLAKAGWLVTGVDFAIKAVAEARKKLEKDGLSGEVLVGDVSRIETVQGSYDLVLDIGCYHGLVEASRAAYRRNLEEILKPGGYLLLYAHLAAAVSESRVGVSPDELEALCKIFRLESRQDSLDRWGRTTTWILLHNQAVPSGEE
jgi:SAM-dependent methyltransferase